MLKSHKLPTLLVSLALLSGVLAAGCGHSNTVLGANGARHVTTFNPAQTSFANSLGITQGPITEAQAREIAVLAAGGGTALMSEREDQDGTEVFGVQVQSPAGEKDVKVRISDGAVTQIEEGGPETGGESPGGEN
jgi:hypothetical protein